jgi:enterochelin esterase-like enzyme
MNIVNRLRYFTGMTTLLLVLTGCGDGKVVTPSEPLSSVCAQVAGKWSLITETDDSLCGGSGKTEETVFTVTQKQCQLTNDNGSMGTIDGTDITWTMPPWSVNGGDVTYSQASAKIQGKQIIGSYEWTWSDGHYQCSGVSKLHGSLVDNGEKVQRQAVNKEKNPMLSPREGTIAHTFSLQAADAKTVYLAGEMSDWQDDVFKMQQGEKGNWDLTLYLLPGAWQYKFVIDEQWRYDHNNPKTIDDGFDGLNSVIVLGKEIAASIPNPDIAHGVIINNDFDSKVLAGKSPFSLYLPPGYSPESGKTYPLLVLLHGYGANFQQWVKVGKIQHFMDNLINAGVIKPFIIVMPSGAKSQYIKGRETHIMDELIPYLRSQYHIKLGRAYTAISGESMGGFGAFYLAQRHPEVFGLSVPLSGYFDMHNYPEFKAEKSVLQSTLYFYCGSDDHISYASNEALVKLLKKGGIDFTYNKAPGNHTWRYWNAISTDVLTNISAFFNP